MPWARWICYLAIALDLEELDSYRFWVLAQQDPKKFQWVSEDKAGTVSPDRVGEKIVAFAQDRFKAAPIKGDIWTLARQRGMKPVYRIEKEDGSVVFVDEHGDKVDPPAGQVFVQSEALKEDKKDKQIYVREGD